ncbi:acyl-CoA dehydrogenase family protein [Pectobacteriaceae bacterium CE70]|nr:acyl-CoA dehydrogenase family protein [Pectobacteriaceae bacterium CE70]
MMTLSSQHVEQALHCGRTAQPAEILSQLTLWITGSQGYLASNGVALYSLQPPLPLLQGDGSAVADTALTTLADDRLLNYLGLAVAQVATSQPGTPQQSLLVAALRLGLAAKILDMSYTHLNQRQSFGQKTTRHQLIKASFSEIYADITQLKFQLILRLEEGDFTGLEQEHDAITQLTNKAEKLMGGHGFLLGNSHTLSHFSMLLYSASGKTGNDIWHQPAPVM